MAADPTVGGTGDDHGERTPRVSVVIASRDRPERLASALAATLAALRPGDDVVVVDSASVDDATAAVAAEAGVPCVRCDEPGLARARNAGVAATANEIVAFTDDDCRPHADWLATTALAFVDPAIGFVAGRVLPEDATGSHTVSVKTDTERRRFAGDVDAAEVGHGANFAARRAALDDVGGFDVLLGAGGRFRAAEDYDFFHRALRVGWHGLFEPDSVVGHDQWRDRMAAVRLQYGYGLGAGAFGVKMLRVARRDGLRILGSQLWRHGLVPLGRDVRARYKTGAAMGVLRVAGTVAGAVQAARLPVRDGRFDT